MIIEYRCSEKGLQLPRNKIIPRWNSEVDSEPGFFSYKHVRWELEEILVQLMSNFWPGLWCAWHCSNWGKWAHNTEFQKAFPLTSTVDSKLFHDSLYCTGMRCFLYLQSPSFSPSDKPYTTSLSSITSAVKVALAAILPPCSCELLSTVLLDLASKHHNCAPSSFFNLNTSWGSYGSHDNPEHCLAHFLHKCS